MKRHEAVRRYAVAENASNDEDASGLVSAAAHGENTPLGILADRLEELDHPAADVVRRAWAGDGVEGDPHEHSMLGTMHASRSNDQVPGYYPVLPDGWRDKGNMSLHYYHLPTGHYWRLDLQHGTGAGVPRRSFLVPTTTEEVARHAAQLQDTYYSDDANAMVTATQTSPPGEHRQHYENDLRSSGIHPDQHAARLAAMDPVDGELVPGPDEIDHNAPYRNRRRLTVTRYAAYRAPAGGMIARGTAYKGGEMVPDMKGSFMNPEPKPIRKSECAAAPSSSSTNDPATKKKFKFDPVKMAALKAKFAKPVVVLYRRRFTVTRYGADHATVDTLLSQLQQPEHNEHRWGLDDPVNGHRGITADALDDVGRGDEAALLRKPNTHVMVHEGRVVPAQMVFHTDDGYRLVRMPINGGTWTDGDMEFSSHPSTMGPVDHMNELIEGRMTEEPDSSLSPPRRTAGFGELDENTDRPGNGGTSPVTVYRRRRMVRRYAEAEPKPEPDQGDGYKIKTPHGYIQYRHRPENSVNEIWWVESHKKNHGSELVDLMQKHHPAETVAWGVTTGDGKRLRDKWHAKHPEIGQDNGAFEGQYDPSGDNYGEDEGDDDDYDSELDDDPEQYRRTRLRRHNLSHGT